MLPPSRPHAAMRTHLDAFAFSDTLFHWTRTTFPVDSNPVVVFTDAW